MADEKEKKGFCASLNCGSSCGTGGCGYLLGFIGAAAYYLGATTGFWASVVGLLKAAVWPVFLVYHLFMFVGA